MLFVVSSMATCLKAQCEGAKWALTSPPFFRHTTLPVYTVRMTSVLGNPFSKACSFKGAGDTSLNRTKVFRSMRKLAPPKRALSLCFHRIRLCDRTSQGCVVEKWHLIDITGPIVWHQAVQFAGFVLLSDRWQLWLPTALRHGLQRQKVELVSSSVASRNLFFFWKLVAAKTANSKRP